MNVYTETIEEQQVEMVEVDNSYEVFRGATLGIDKMRAGSFYTNEVEIANNYAQQEETPAIYCFSIAGLDIISEDELLDMDIDFDIDEGIINVPDYILEKYDGLSAQDGAQFILFGTLNCNDGKWEKGSVSEIRESQDSELRRFDR